MNMPLNDTTTNNLTYHTKQLNQYNSVIASYQGAVAPRSPGCRYAVVGAGQEADLGSGWRFVLIAQTVVHAAGLPDHRSLLHTPSRAAGEAV